MSHLYYVIFRLIFVFHKNNVQYVKAKVKPPRLNGKRVGLFSTRSPYRPNPIGLTLAKLESVAGIIYFVLSTQNCLLTKGFHIFNYSKN